MDQARDDAASQVKDVQERLRDALRELEASRAELREAREASKKLSELLDSERTALAASRARTSELHKLGVDMERELTALLEGDDRSLSLDAGQAAPSYPFESLGIPSNPSQLFLVTPPCLTCRDQLVPGE